ncbi:MAG: Crp/Fnr family transcriptional regulator [Actinomycetota bacterium]
MGVALDRTEGGVTRRIPHGEVIVRQGDAVTSLYLVNAGAVRLSAVTASGREIVVGLLCQGDLFGESALLGDPSQVRAQAVGPTMLLALPIPSLRSILEHNPHTAEELLRLVAARLHRTSAALEDALSADVSTRVAGRLRDLAIHHGIPSPTGVRLRVPLTQDELARMVGASRESVNRSVGALAARGVVRSSGRRLVITDPDALGVWAAPG